MAAEWGRSLARATCTGSMDIQISVHLRKNREHNPNRFKQLPILRLKLFKNREKKAEQTNLGLLRPVHRACCIDHIIRLIANKSTNSLRESPESGLVHKLPEHRHSQILQANPPLRRS
jgi:hypothetical protein